MPELPDAIADAGRLAAVVRTGLLDTPPDESFDALARLAAHLLDAPYAFVTIVDEQRSFWKAAVGLPEGSPRQNTVQESFCQYVIDRPGELLVGDAATHPVTKDNPSIEAMGVAAWAGATVMSRGGQPLGSFCVVDNVTRDWTERDRETIRVLAEAASTQVALLETLDSERRALRDAQALARALESVLLPPTLPAPAGLAVAGRHRGGSDGAPLLSTFYDVFASDRVTYAILGEVSADGPAAAGVTGLVRFGARTAATWAGGPAELMALIDEMLGQQAPGDVFVSIALVALRERGAGGIEARVANAGYTTVLRAGAGATEAVGRPGRLLGSGQADTIEEATVSLAPGQALVLHADGATHAGRGEAHVAPRFDATADAPALAQATLDALRDEHAAAALAVLVV